MTNIFLQTKKRDRDRDGVIRYDHYQTMDHRRQTNQVGDDGIVTDDADKTERDHAVMDSLLSFAENNGNELQFKTHEMIKAEEVSESSSSSEDDDEDSYEDEIEEEEEDSESDDDDDGDDSDEEATTTNGGARTLVTHFVSSNLLDANMAKLQQTAINCIDDHDNEGLEKAISDEVSSFSDGAYNQYLNGRDFHSLLGINGPIFNYALEHGCTDVTEILIEHCESLGLSYDNLKFSSFMTGIRHLSDQLTKETQKVARSFVEDNVREFHECNFGIFLELAAKDIGPCVDELVMTITDFFLYSWTPRVRKINK